MESLTADLVGLMRLDRASLGALACTSTTMRQTVADVWCSRGITIRERHLPCISHARFAGLRSLAVVGPSQPHTAAPTPAPVPRGMPSLHTLRLVHTRPYGPGFWATLFERAPALDSLEIHPVFYGVNYCDCLVGCMEMLRGGADRLTSLVVRGDGLAWNGLAWGAREDGRKPPTFDAFNMNKVVAGMATVTFARLRDLTITGRQFFPSVDAPLVRATLEEASNATNATTMVHRLGPLARRHLESLVWSVPAAQLAFPVLAALHTLDLSLRDLTHPPAFDAAMNTLSHVPASLTSLSLSLDFHYMSGEDPPLRFDVAPLAHLRGLHTLAVRLSFPTRDCGHLFSALLGLPPGTLRRVTLEAEGGPADRLKNVRDLMLEDECDPEDDQFWELQEEIDELEHACKVPLLHLHAGAAAFPMAQFCVKGFQLTFPCTHPRVTHVYAM